MTTDQHIPAAGTGARPSFARLAIATGAAIIGNIVALWIGTLAGATWQTSAPEPVNIVVVIVATAIPMIVGGLIALAIIKRKPGFQSWAAWGGLVFAVVTLPMPFLAAKDVATGAGLAAMHVITGIAWLVVFRPKNGG